LSAGGGGIPASEAHVKAPVLAGGGALSAPVTARRWQLRLDAAACEGHGICALRCPERVSLDEWGYPSVDSSPFEESLIMRRARLAAAACPEHALSLVVSKDTKQRGRP
jgi:ferredoxin